jgi:uncharacterized nucleotidyltransferase DUF6036
MPDARARDRSRIEDALAALQRALSELDAPWMVIGGIAVIAHGVQRMTTDIDAVIRGDAALVPAVLKALRHHQIVARIADAEAFAATNLVLLTRHRPTEVDLDLSLGWTSFEHEALEARAATRYGKVSVPMARVEDLIVFKAIAARPRDIDDAVTLLALYPHIDMARVRVRVRTLARAAEAPELEQGLAEIVAASKAATKHRSLPPRSRNRPARSAAKIGTAWPRSTRKAPKRPRKKPARH